MINKHFAKSAAWALPRFARNGESTEGRGGGGRLMEMEIEMEGGGLLWDPSDTHKQSFVICLLVVCTWLLWVHVHDSVSACSTMKRWRRTEQL